MKDVFFITRQILAFRLGKANDTQEEISLVQQFLAFGRFYVVADTATTKEDWEAKTFGIHTESRAIHLYLDRTDAHQKAISIKSVLPDNSSMVIPVTSEIALSLISDYAHKDIISAVWLCGKSPVTAKVGLYSLLKNFRDQSSSTIMSDSIYEEQPSLVLGESKPLKSPSEIKEFRLTAEIRQTLNLASAEERRKLDPSNAYMNLSRMLEKLIQANGLDMNLLDEILGLPIGFTANLCNSKRSDVIPKAKVEAYDAFIILVDLIENPKDTLQRLKYRETDPQYQKTPKEKGIK